MRSRVDAVSASQNAIPACSFALRATAADRAIWLSAGKIAGGGQSKQASTTNHRSTSSTSSYADVFFFGLIFYTTTCNRDLQC